MPEPALDRQIRLRAFEHVQTLERRFRTLSWDRISRGFKFNGETIHLATRAKGIFKPRQMKTLLSIKTVIPKEGRKVWYDDQNTAQQAAFEDCEHFEYALEGTGPSSPANKLLREASEQGLPIIYFFPLAPGQYHAIAPTFVYGFNADAGKCAVGPGEIPQTRGRTIEMGLYEKPDERRYAVRQVQQRLHQSMFRQAVLSAYGRRCAISALPETSLLDAAHIVEDMHETLGQPVVQNGLPLSNIHHKAYDNDLIGIDPDYRVHVSPRLLELDDGPILEALKSVHDARIRLPERPVDYPDRERLDLRFERFLAAA